MQLTFDQSKIRKWDDNDLPEWILPNGLGGYASGSANGELFRKHHGYLIAAQKPPINRVLILAKTQDTVVANATTFSFDRQKTPHMLVRGDRYLRRFRVNPVPEFEYAVDAVEFTKSVVPYYGHNACMIRYRIRVSNQPIRFIITPLFNDRDHGDVSTAQSLPDVVELSLRQLILRGHKASSEPIYFQVSAGRLEYRSNTITPELLYAFDQRTGDDRLDVHFKPVDVILDLEANATATVDLVCSLEPLDRLPQSDPFDHYLQRLDRIVQNAQPRDDFEKLLIQSSDAFIAWRQSTNQTTVLAGLPWFADWGRDTMIAFPGLFLSTHRYQEAKEVLASFLVYLKDGLIPNMFPDDGAQPLYNTVDASLWYLNACYLYWQATKDDDFVKDTLLPAMQSIIEHYQKGTAFSIRMEPDGLISAGNGNDQITWMDVRIHGYAVTPRHGKPVEINALWYNGLMAFSTMSDAFGSDTETIKQLAKRVKKAFHQRFWATTNTGLKDVVDADDESIRPNQLVAIALPFSMLSRPQMKRVVALAKAELLDIYGIRTLSYRDPRFKQTYDGPLILRDHNYHMGTSWGYLMGIYLESFLIANRQSNIARKEVALIYRRLAKHLTEGSLGGVAEVFDGYQGTISRGCHTQAWSVAEWLRIYKDYQIPTIGKIQ
jgi:predicted glycogen debranching enzyme